MAKKGPALGRGLNALLDTPEKVEQVREMVSGTIEINVDEIEVNPYQPRSNFDETALEELAESIKKHGIIQPITVRKIDDGKYQIISGERRFRASKIANLKTVPVFIRTADDQGMLELALIENIQREDLDAIEVATSYNRLIEECSLTQELLGERVGKKRATVTNYLRLLKLPAEIQLAIRDKKISMGHARALLGIDNEKLQNKIAKKIIDEGWSVRQIEDFVKKQMHEKNKKPIKQHTEMPDSYYKLGDCLGHYFNNNVSIVPNKKGGGKITINFNSEDEINNLMQKLEL